MRQIVIPMTERDKYIRCDVRTTVVADSQGDRQVIWPQALDMPTGLQINIKPSGHIESVECLYLKDLGESVPHFINSGRYFSRVYRERGMLHQFGLVEPPKTGPDAYKQLLTVIERLYDCATFLPSDSNFKWKLIFSTEMVLTEWRKGKKVIPALLSGQSPYR